MSDSDIPKRLTEIVRRFCEPDQGGLLGMMGYPFDVKKPNIHDSKSEFIAEKLAVEKALSNTQALLDFLTARSSDEDDLSEISVRVTNSVDRFCRDRQEYGAAKNSFEMITNSARNVGLSLATGHLLMELVYAYDERLKELGDQEREFWSGKHRPPNHYARTIALRFARVVARGTGEMPTFGTSRDGGHPSTEFGRALEEVFLVLGIKANVRNAARWAIGELTEQDLRPPHPSGLLDLLSSEASTSASTTKPKKKGKK